MHWVIRISTPHAEINLAFEGENESGTWTISAVVARLAENKRQALRNGIDVAHRREVIDCPWTPGIVIDGDKKSVSISTD